MGISFRRVGANLAAEVEGIDLAKPLPDAEARDAIRDGLAEHQLLIFRDQVISSDRLMEFGRSFGELSVHPFAPHVEDTPALIRFGERRRDAAIRHRRVAFRRDLPRRAADGDRALAPRWCPRSAATPCSPRCRRPTRG